MFAFIHSVLTVIFLFFHSTRLLSRLSFFSQFVRYFAGRQASKTWCFTQSWRACFASAECPQGQRSHRACLGSALGGAMALPSRAPGCAWSSKLVLDVAPARTQLFSQASRLYCICWALEPPGTEGAPGSEPLGSPPKVGKKLRVLHCA